MSLNRFNGLELKMLRVFYKMSLENVAAHVGTSKQYIHKLETGQTQPSEELIGQFANIFKVKSNMFFKFRPIIQEEQVHFRSQKSSNKATRQIVITRAAYMVRLIEYIETKLDLPVFALEMEIYNNVYTDDDIEKIAEKCRNLWEVGLGPISNMSRLCENLGIIITNASLISKDIDALSLAAKRPIIVRNDAKESACRQRFDLGHELGHLVLHDGIITGDRLTEGQAHRFSGAFLLPRTMLLENFYILFNGRFNWKKMSEFKEIWKISKAAILYRARQLGLLTDDQYRSGVIYLKVNGEALREAEDSHIPLEESELLANCIALLAKKDIFAEDIAEYLDASPAFIESLTGLKLPRRSFEPNKIVKKSLKILH